MLDDTIWFDNAVCLYLYFGTIILIIHSFVAMTKTGLNSRHGKNVVPSLERGPLWARGAMQG